jgi:hypothetical protein
MGQVLTAQDAAAANIKSEAHPQASVKVITAHSTRSVYHKTWELDT